MAVPAPVAGGDTDHADQSAAQLRAFLPLPLARKALEHCGDIDWPLHHGPSGRCVGCAGIRHAVPFTRHRFEAPGCRPRSVATAVKGVRGWLPGGRDDVPVRS
jgi:hypothetical protein